MDEQRETDRLKRVHVVGLRTGKDGYLVVMSDPELDAAGSALRADTWDITWEAWVRCGADVNKL